MSNTIHCKILPILVKILHGETQKSASDALGVLSMERLIEAAEVIEDTQYAYLAPWDCAKNEWGFSPFVCKDVQTIRSVVTYFLMRKTWKLNSWVNSVFSGIKQPNFCTIIDYREDTFSVVRSSQNCLNTPVFHIKIRKEPFDRIFDELFVHATETSVSQVIDVILEKYMERIQGNGLTPGEWLVIGPEDVEKELQSVANVTALEGVDDLEAKMKRVSLGSLEGLKGSLQSFFSLECVESLLRALIFAHTLHKHYLVKNSQSYPLFFHRFQSNVLSDSDSASDHILGGACGFLFNTQSEIDNGFEYLLPAHLISSSLLTRVAVIQNRYWYAQASYASTRSALAAIMSRNASHNIGSHVLVRLAQESLSGNVTYGRGAPKQTDITFDPMGLVIGGAYEALDEASKITTLGNSEHKFLRHHIGSAIHYLEAVHDQVNPHAKPGKSKQETFAQDCKVLAAYVQSRMDFIAQICTERPHWTISSCLCHDVMAHFFQQSKILEHIAASENLTTARFEHDGTLLAPPKNTGRIKFVIRYKKSANETDEWETVLSFGYKTGDIPTIIQERRIPVSFPGGRGGWHAFYVIIEGVIRNAAKHAYSKYAKDNPSVNPPDLVVGIDVIDGEKIKDEKADKPAYTVRVYTNVDIEESVSIVDEGKEKQIFLSEALNKKLKTPFTQADGKLNMENWGFAEIRAAIGHLRQTEVMKTGSETHEIVSIQSCMRTVPPLYYDDWKIRFYYEFKLLKPQVIGIETKDEAIFKTNGKDANQYNKIKDDRQNEGWFVFGDENKQTHSFEFFVIDGREAHGTDFGKALVKLLKVKDVLESNGFSEFKANNQVFAKLVHYPGRLFVLCDKEIGIPIKERHAQLRRICALVDSTTNGTKKHNDYETFCKFYNGQGNRKPGQIGTEAAAECLHKKWLEHWLRYRTDKDKAPVQLSLYHYLTEGDASGGEATYMPDTTPYQVKKEEKDKNTSPGSTTTSNNPITIHFSQEQNNGKPTDYALVFGRHWGALGTDKNPLEFRWDNRNPDNYNGNVLYAEAMTGGASYFSYAKHEIEDFAKKQANEPGAVVNCNILSFAESALMRVVVIDERVQEQCIKQKSSVLVGTAEQQVFVGYLNDTAQSGNDFSQKKPQTEADIYKTGFVDVNFESVAGDNKIPNLSIQLERSLETDSKIKNQTELLWAENFEPDMLIIHQGILDKWAEQCQIVPKEGPSGDYARYCPKDKPQDKKQAQIGILLDTLRQRVPFVVITSGRGRPVQVPKGFSFIPLSSFDPAPKSTMYEKFPLVQQILAIVEEEKT